MEPHAGRDVVCGDFISFGRKEVIHSSEIENDREKQRLQKGR
jgi:hypothetical protein